MIKRLLMGAVSMFCVAGYAQADVLSKCKSRVSVHDRIDACTRVVSGSGFKPMEKSAAYRIRGTLRMEAGADEQAIQDFNNAIALNPKDDQAYSGRGTLRLVAGNQSAAIADFDRAIGLKPGLINYLVLRGHALLVAGKLDAAIEDFNQAIARSPKNSVALNNRGLAHRKIGDIEKAIIDYTAAIAASPLYALAYNNRGYAFEAMAKKAEAVQDFRRALSIDPSLSAARIALERLGAAGDLAAQAFRLTKEGKTLAEKNCAWCHAIEMQGNSPNPDAPPFRDLKRRHPLLTLREPLERGIAAPHEAMPQFEMTKAQIQSLVAFINSLK